MADGFVQMSIFPFVGKGVGETCRKKTYIYKPLPHTHTHTAVPNHAHTHTYNLLLFLPDVSIGTGPNENALLCGCRSENPVLL